VLAEHPPAPVGAGPRGGLTAHLDAEFTAGAPGVIARTTHSAALELRGPFEGAPLPRFFLRNVTAGILDGDAYRIDLRVRTGARLAVAPTSATKVFTARGRGARSALRIEVEPGALLDYDAGVTILQRDCDLEQSTELLLHAGSALAYREVIALGRLAAGERLAFARYAAALSLGVPGEAARYEERCNLRLPEDREAIDAALGGYGVLGTLILVGFDAWPIPGCAPDVYAGMTKLPNDAGVLVRALGERVEPVQQLLATIVEAAAEHEGRGRSD
jgi:urease accessory protein